MTQLGKVQKLVLRTTVRNGVQIKRTGLDDIFNSLEEADTYWEKRWVGRKQLKRGVYERRENDVSRASNRVSVSRAVHTLVDKEMLDAQFPATGSIIDGGMKITHYGPPSVVDQGKIGEEDSTPTYSLIRLSNKGEKVVRSLRSGERNKWDEEIRGDQF